ncbi:MAG: lysophospholipid acyltransferase family protein [Chloroflexi bacterium]|nr:lysophospholipid acyltransferase family protein [Chloroflexota bacterium]
MAPSTVSLTNGRVLAYRFAAWLLARTPEAIGYPVFGLIGTLAYGLGRSARRRVAAAMRNVLGSAASEREVERATRESFRNLAWNYYELFHLPASAADAIRQRMDIQGLEHLFAALERGRGIVLTSLHFGNTEVLMQVPVLYPQLRFALLIEKLASRPIFELMRQLRGHQGIELIPVDEPVKIMRCLKQNRTLGIAADRDVTHSGIVIDFFGKPARLPDGPVRLALRTGAALIPTYGWRESTGRFAIRVLPPLTLERSGDSQQDILTNMSRLVNVFEWIIRQHPGQWMAFHPIWVDAAPPSGSI